MANAAEILLTGPHLRRVTRCSGSAWPAACCPTTRCCRRRWEVAHDMAVNTAPMSVAFSKRVLWAELRPRPRPRSNQLETELHHHLMGSADAQEGVMAFLERRDAGVAGQRGRRLARDWPGGRGLHELRDDHRRGAGRRRPAREGRGRHRRVDRPRAGDGAGAGVGRRAGRARRSRRGADRRRGRDRSARRYPTRCSSIGVLDLTSLDSVRGVRRRGTRRRTTTACTC